MGWGNCGLDSKGRPIGYLNSGICDHEGCDAEIDRGLAYACGGMHGNHDERSEDGVCEGYFCYEHLTMIERGSHTLSVCFSCAKDIADAT